MLSTIRPSESWKENKLETSVPRGNSNNGNDVNLLVKSTSVSITRKSNDVVRYGFFLQSNSTLPHAQIIHDICLRSALDFVKLKQILFLTIQSQVNKRIVLWIFLLK